jgi:sec-independent protein translocase protein TatA
MPNIGLPELILILVIVLLVFGAGKLPDIGRALGKSISEFKKAKEEGEKKEEPKVAAAQKDAEKPAQNSTTPK